MKKAGGSLGLVTVRTTQKSIKKTRRQWLVLLACAVVLMLGSAFPSGSLAATCEVGDFSKGYWTRIANPEGCIIPGPPAAASPWPINAQGVLNPQGISRSAYRIEGKYKLSASISADGFSLTIPPTRPECITGFAEAYTAASRVTYMGSCPESGCFRCNFVAQGTLLTQHSWDCNGSFNPYQYAYLRFFEVNFQLEEWVWTNKDCNKEEPPPTPTNTPNPDPGKPDCPQAPLN